MRMYLIPHPYDYHAQGAYIVLAKSRKDALKKLEAKKLVDSDTKIDEIEAIKGDIYEDGGCDC